MGEEGQVADPLARFYTGAGLLTLGIEQCRLLDVARSRH